jgi:hypothetical protein
MNASPHEFHPGAIVMRDRDVMLVLRIEDDRARCAWYEAQTRFEGDFLLSELRLLVGSGGTAD